MKLKQSLCIIGAMTALNPAPVLADTVGEGNWMVRLRATYLDISNKSDGNSDLKIPNDAITVNNKWIPELDVSYFFTDHIATELVLTYPQKQSVKLGGNDIGTFKHLPPTLLVQYHILPKGDVRPYVGAGINATHISSVNLSAGPGADIDLDSWSFGPALQAGMDIKLTQSWYMNIDFKKVWISSDVKLNGNKISNVQLDPWLFSFGVGYRF